MITSTRKRAKGRCDESDLRFLDKPGVVVGLIAKGKARRNPGTFVVPRQVVAA